jgi:hypothetical protein
MFRRGSLVVKAALCVTAFLLSASLALAGEHVRSPQQAPVSSSVVRTASQPVTFSVMVKPVEPPRAPVFVNLRGPDGKVRRFPLEGDIVVLSPGSQVSVRPGRSLTIWWMAVK